RILAIPHHFYRRGHGLYVLGPDGARPILAARDPCRRTHRPVQRLPNRVGALAAGFPRSGQRGQGGRRRAPVCTARPVRSRSRRSRAHRFLCVGHRGQLVHPASAAGTGRRLLSGPRSDGLIPFRPLRIVPSLSRSRGITLMARWLVFTAAFALTGCFNGVLLRPVHVDAPLDGPVFSDAQSCFCRSKVAIIDGDGMTLNAKTSSILGDGSNPVSLFREKLDAAAEDKRVKAVVLRVNPPGGAVTAS